jgi:copper homeostasis protein
MPIALECCVDSVASAVAAESGGASRLELCGNLVEGGTTPSLGLLRILLRHIRIPVHVMVRPRGGDFLYTEAELSVMREDIRAIRDAGAHGVVLGVLTADGRVDEPVLRELVALAAPLPLTFHRAIDVAAEPLAAVEACARCGVARILTSGGTPTAELGLPTLRRMVAAADGRLLVAAGGGVAEENCARIAVDSHADELHGSLRVTRRSAMRVRPDPPIPMGAQKLNGPESEFDTKEADQERVRAVVALLRPLEAPRPRPRPRPRPPASRLSALASAVRTLLLAPSRLMCLLLPPLLPLPRRRLPLSWRRLSHPLLGLLPPLELPRLLQSTSRAPPAPPPSLDELGLRYLSAASRPKDKYAGGDKTSAGQGFTSFYSELLSPRRHERGLVLVEIGVWYGKSLAMFCDFFTAGDAELIGVDINLGRWHEHRPELERMGAFTRNTTRALEYDTYSDTFAHFARTQLPPPDIVLDDGNHNAASQWHVFSILWPCLRPGGTYIIEDIEQPAPFFELDSSGGGGGNSMILFHVIVAQVANESYGRSGALQQAVDMAGERAEARRAKLRAQAAQQVERLRQRIASVEGAGQGQGGGRGAGGAHVTEGADEDSSAHARLRASLAAKEAELASIPESISKAEASRLRAGVVSQLQAAVELAASVATVQVRRNNVVFVKK